MTQPGWPHLETFEKTLEATAFGAFPVCDITGQGITEPDLLGTLLESSIELSLWRIRSMALLIG